MAKKFVYGLIVLCCALVLWGMDIYQPINTVAMDPVKAAGEQLRKLVNVSKELTPDGPFKATVKWQGNWDTLLAPEEAANALTSRLGLSNPAMEDVQGHDVYTSYSAENGIHAKLSVTPQGDGKYYVILRLEGMISQGETGELAQLQEQYAVSLMDEGVQVQWNASLQGVLNTDGSGLQSVTANLLAMEQTVSGILGLQLVEEYEDRFTASRSYSTKALPLSVASQDQAISLQMAVHLNEEQGNSEISIGSPLLTIEY